MSVQIVGSEANLAEQVAEFSAQIEPALVRWRYASRAGTKVHESSRYGKSEVVNQRAVPALARLLGVSKVSTRHKLAVISRLGFDDAVEFGRQFDAKRLTDILPDYFAVGPLQQWCCGHVYFARVKSHQHVLKIGFSRRVRDRLEDVAAKHKTSLLVPAGHLKVGTQADERWWHADWAKFHIQGEWFFDPKSADRSLPHFLTSLAEAA